MRDLCNNISLKTLLPSQALASGQEFVGPAVDLRGAGSCLIFLCIGDKAHDISEESKASFFLEHGLQESSLSLIEAPHFSTPLKEKGLFFSLDHPDQTSNLYRFVYKGPHSFLRLKVRTEGDYKNGTIVSSFLLLGALSYAPPTLKLSS